MQLEASGRQQDAVVIYQNILASDETNIVRPLPSIHDFDSSGR